MDTAPMRQDVGVAMKGLCPAESLATQVAPRIGSSHLLNWHFKKMPKAEVGELVSGQRKPVS